ncbi:MAG TPA: hypothetical protein VFE24_17995 [Pirellulales bacterium]|nr:hypothetical protein [Pirellulales bacterium]
MIAPIRPPLVKRKRRPLRETPLERARRAVADSLLPTAHEERLRGWQISVRSLRMLAGLAGLAVLLGGLYLALR